MWAMLFSEEIYICGAEEHRREGVHNTNFTHTSVDVGSVPMKIAYNLLLAAGPILLSEIAPSLLADFYTTPD